MTLLGDKLKKAGVNTAEARFMTLAIEALREADGSVSSAAIALWAKLKNESWVAKEVWLIPYLQERKRDMEGSQPTPRVAHSVGKSKAAEKITEGLTEVLSIVRGKAKPARLNVLRTSPEERKAAVEKIIQKAVHAIKFGCITSDGRDWAQVGAHELDGMQRDGSLARRIKDKLGVLTNAQKFMPIGEIITPELFRQAQKEALIT